MSSLLNVSGNSTKVHAWLLRMMHCCTCMNYKSLVSAISPSIISNLSVHCRKALQWMRWLDFLFGFFFYDTNSWLTFVLLSGVFLFLTLITMIPDSTPMTQAKLTTQNILCETVPSTFHFRIKHWYFYHCSSDDASSIWSNSCYAYPSPEEERPPPPYPSSSSSSSSSSCSFNSLPHNHFNSRAHMIKRPIAPTPESVSPGPSPPPRLSGHSPPPLPHSLCPSPQQLDVNCNPKPNVLHLPKQASLPDGPHAPHFEMNGTTLYIKPPLVLTRHNLFLGSPKPPNTPLSAPPPWAGRACSRERGATLKR